MLPFTEKEFLKWPFRSEFLAHYYDFVSEHVPISAVQDKLAKLYPMPKQIKYHLRPTLRFKSLIEKPSKETPNACIGLPRLAVRNGEGFSNCVYCEKCITGCNYNLIWNTSGYWSRLPQDSKYFSGRRVLKIFTEGGNNFVQWIDLENKLHSSGPYQKVFLGCGPLETFRIFSESTGAPRVTRVLDSNIIFSPIFIGGRKKDEKSHTLAQAFLYLTDPQLGDVNVQLYDYSDDLISRVKSLNFLARLIPNFILKWFLNKFIYCLIYLDSDDSSEIKLSINEGGSMNLSEVLKEKNSSHQALRIVGDWCRKNSLVLIKPLAKKGAAGEGVHYGGSIPFGIDVKESGEVSRFPGLYLIDSSTFPHIPAGPITFTIMANSARIVDNAS
jgi:ferredoxin